MDKSIFEKLAKQLAQQGFNIVAKDFERPWGGFFVVDEQQAQAFADCYFDGLNVDSLRIGGKLSPKILVVTPQKRLSWQYHNRRAEIWQVLEGNVGVVRSATDVENELEVMKPGNRIVLGCGERHRLVGLQDWAVLAEIWQHTDPQNPTDEDDIVRLQDDFGR